MAKWRLLLLLFFVLTVEGKGGRGGWSGGSRGGGRSGGRGSSSSGGGWFSGWFGKSSSSVPAVPKPATTGLGAVQKPSSGGFAKKDLPSQNIGPGGYPVQKSNLSPPPYSPTNLHGTAGQTRVGPPSYHSPHGAPPAYYPGRQNGYHYAAPPAYSASHYGMSSAYYPPRNNFGYSGGYYGNSRPSYAGLDLYGNRGNYGYPSSGYWGGGYSSYGAQRSSSTGSFLMGAASGYMASSLINSLTNPWRYSGYGYGHGYMDRYRYDRQPATGSPAAAPDPTNNWINCIAYDPATNNTLINPNCTCTVTTTTDAATGQNISHHDCTPFAQQTPSLTPPDSIYGVNNPPPAFNGSLYGNGASYGAGYPVGPPIDTSQAQSDALTGDGVQQKRMEFYTNLQRIVNMGRFVR